MWPTVIHWVLKHKWLVLGVVVALVAGAFLGYGVAVWIVGAGVAGEVVATGRGDKLARKVQDIQTKAHAKEQELREDRDNQVQKAKDQAAKEKDHLVHHPDQLAHEIDEYLHGGGDGKHTEK